MKYLIKLLFVSLLLTSYSFGYEIGRDPITGSMAFFLTRSEAEYRTTEAFRRTGEVRWDYWHQYVRNMNQLLRNGRAIVPSNRGNLVYILKDFNPPRPADPYAAQRSLSEQRRLEREAEARKAREKEELAEQKRKAREEALLEAAREEGRRSGEEYAKAARAAKEAELLARIEEDVNKIRARTEASRARTKELKNRIARYEAFEGLCFTGDTLVCISKLVSKPIETIREGDWVITFDPEENKLVYCQVTRVYERTAHELIHLSYLGKTVRVTPEHPYFTIDRGWVEAKDLIPNEDQLQGVSGDPIILEDKSEEFGTFRVYNLEVDGTHTYYACDALVHNCNSTVAVAGTVLSQSATALAYQFLPDALSVVTAAVGPVAGPALVVGSAVLGAYALQKMARGNEETAGVNTLSVGHYPSADQWDRMLGGTKGDFHDKIKEEIIKDHSKEIREQGIGKNPDIGYDKKTKKVTFKDRITGKEYQSDTPVDNYKDE